MTELRRSDGSEPGEIAAEERTGVSSPPSGPSSTSS